MKTEAWVLEKGPSVPEPGQLVLKTIELPNPTNLQVIAEPVFGSWEGNMTHALERDPVDICRQRGEDWIVLGNAGVVRVVSVGAHVTRVKPGDVCGLVSAGKWDDRGYPLTILAYDDPGSMGMLSKRTVLREDQLFVINNEDVHTLKKWAAFPIRYATAWDNWQVSLGAWRLQCNNADDVPPHVWGWGGGVAFGELVLARRLGCKAVLITSNPARRELCKEHGIETVDRNLFADLDYDAARVQADFQWRKRYMRAERIFLQIVNEMTDGTGVSIFIDNIGQPVYRATLKSLGRMGIITTSGWKEGMELAVARGRECISRHIHVYTHGARSSTDSIEYAAAHDWLPPVESSTYAWKDIPKMAEDYASGRIESLFPIFEVNAL